MHMFVPIPIHRIYPVESKANETLRRLNPPPFFLGGGGEEMAKLSKALNFLRSDVPGSIPLNVYFKREILEMAVL